ncbi:MAG: glycosyltransferase [Candidatus Omnitrophota bacterium]|nr:glycosyltransferase [Candidatus Omnitrophota bacterium]
MTVSIIIAAKTWAKNLEECVRRCQELDYPDFEIIILPDDAFTKELSPKGTVPISVISTGPVSPAKKRDIALAYAKGEILAFIDDDAYPEKDWLKNAVKNFSAPDVVAVGGPAITPKEDNLRQRASGKVFSSSLVSGKYIYRYLPKKRLEVDDYPTCNFFVRKSIMEALGGFKTNFWPGEDTKLCLDITKELRKKIIYDPEVLVYHHRRPLFLPHLKQVANYALHRGYFVKKYPETSLQFSYFIPTLFLFLLIGGAFLSLNLVPFRIIYFFGLFLYLLLVFFFSVSKELRLIPLVFFGIILTHLTYGFWFVKGLLSKKLKEEL